MYHMLSMFGAVGATGMPVVQAPFDESPGFETPHHDPMLCNQACDRQVYMGENPDQDFSRFGSGYFLRSGSSSAAGGFPELL